MEVNYNYRGARTGQYTIDSAPSSPPIQRYMSGTTINEKLIVLGSVEAYGEDVRVQLGNVIFYEELEAWIEQQNRLKNFPQTPDGTVPMKLECVTDGFLAAVDNPNAAFYQIQLKLTYKKGGTR